MPLDVAGLPPSFVTRVAEPFVLDLGKTAGTQKTLGFLIPRGNAAGAAVVPPCDWKRSSTRGHWEAESPASVVWLENQDSVFPIYRNTVKTFAALRSNAALLVTSSQCLSLWSFQTQGQPLLLPGGGAPPTPANAHRLALGAVLTVRLPAHGA